MEAIERKLYSILFFSVSGSAEDGAPDKGNLKRLASDPKPESYMREGKHTHPHCLDIYLGGRVEFYLYGMGAETQTADTTIRRDGFKPAEDHKE